MPRDKYEDRGYSGKLLFFHRYTGWITISIVLFIIFIAWLFYDDTTFFFENWSCGMIYEMGTLGLSEEELNRHAEIIQECDNRPEKFQEPQVP